MQQSKLGILLLIWLLKVSQVQAAPLPGADGFTPTYTCRKRQTYSREATGLSTRLEQNPNNQNRPQRTNTSQYIPEFDSIINKFRKNINMHRILESQAIIIRKMHSYLKIKLSNI